MGRKKNIEQREQIVFTAYKMFYDNGYDKVTMREIASACQITPSLLQHYYNKKEDIVIEIFYDLILRIYSYLDERYSEITDSRISTAMFYRLFYEVLTADDNKLLNIYYKILGNSELLCRATDYALSQPTAHTLGETLSENLSIYMLNGTLSQLFTLHLSDKMQLGTMDIVNIALYSYFGFLRFRPDEVISNIALVNSLLTKSSVNEFIAAYKRAALGE